MGNPFQNFFDPSNETSAFSSFTGTIGRAFGMPTQQERVAQAEADTMQKLSGHLKSSGGSPQKAIINFLQTPEGQSLMSQPGGVGTLEKWTKAITPPAPTAITTGPGQTSDIFQGGKRIGQTSVAPTEVQNYTGLVGKLKNQDPALLDALAINIMNPNEVQQRNLHIDNLVKNKVLTPEEGDKFASGMIDVIKGTNDVGEFNGQYIILDKAGKKGHLITPGAQSATGGGTVVGGQATGTGGTSIPSSVSGAPAHVIPPDGYNEDGSINGDKLTARKYMGLGVGVLPAGLSLMGTAVRQINPSNDDVDSAQASVRRSQFDALDTAVTAVGAKGGRLKTQTETWRELMPSKWTDAPDAYRKLIQLHGRVSGMIAQEDQTYRNVMLPKKSREEAQDNIQRLQNVLTTIPTPAESQQMLADLKAGTAGAITPARAGQSMYNMGRSAVESGVSSVQELTNGQPVPGQKTTATPAKLPPELAPARIMKLDENGLRDVATKLPPGPSEARTAWENRAKAILQGKNPPAKPKGAPGPALGTESNVDPMSGQVMNYDLADAKKYDATNTGDLESWLKNPTRNFMPVGKAGVKNAKYGSDGNWHVYKDGSWHTITTPGK